MNRFALSLLALSACTGPRPSVTRSTPSPSARLRLALASPEPRSTLEVLGVSLAFHDTDPSGSKSAIVCLHAIGHGGADFARFARDFSDRYRIVTLDWPGQGASGGDSETASAVRYTALLREVVRALKLERFVLVGNSIGGAVAIRYAAEHPEAVRALVLANPGGLAPIGWLERLFIGHLVGRFEAGVRGDPGFQRWFEGYYADILCTAPAAEHRRAIVASGYEVAPVLAEAWRSFAAPEADLRPLVPRVHAPVLFTWASQDRYVRWSGSEEAVRRFPNAQVVQLPAGHSPFLETPHAFDAAVRRFLSDLP